MRDEPATDLPAPDPGGPMDDPSAELRICPFLRAVNGDDSPGAPIRRPDQANRCIALGDAAPQSLRQQELVCLTSDHVDCPRFVRGAQGIIGLPAGVERPGLTPTPAIVGALLVLAASFALSVGFVVANGGMDLPAAASGGPQTAVESMTPSSSPPAETTAEPTVGASPEASVTPPGEPPASTAPSAEPSLAETPPPSPTVTAAPTVAPTPGPTSDRYALLKACPDVPDCWIYVVQNGDNLVSIARYFGVPFEVLTDLNPWTKTTQLVAGQELRLPPPTR